MQERRTNSKSGAAVRKVPVAADGAVIETHEVHDFYGSEIKIVISMGMSAPFPRK